MNSITKNKTPSWLTAAHLRAYLILGLSILIIGCSAIFVSYASAPAEVIVFYRMTVASLAMVVPFGQNIRKTGKLASQGIWLAVLGGLLFTANFYFWAIGVQVGGATIPTLFANSSPIWVSLGAFLLFRERLPLAFFGGLGLAMIGSIAITLSGASLEDANNQGALYGSLSALFFGGYFLVSQRARINLDALSFFWITTFTSGLSVLLLVICNGSALWGYSALTWLMFIVMGLVSQVAGFLAVSYVMGYLPASLVSTAMLLQLVVTAGLAQVLLQETLSWAQCLGGMLVAFGVWIIIRSRPS